MVERIFASGVASGLCVLNRANALLRVATRASRAFRVCVRSWLGAYLLAALALSLCGPSTVLNRANALPRRDNDRREQHSASPASGARALPASGSLYTAFSSVHIGVGR